MNNSHVFSGVSFPYRFNGDRLADFIREIERQREARRDAIVNTKNVSMIVAPVTPSHPELPRENKFALECNMPGEGKVVMPLTKTAWNQVLDYVGLPTTSRFVRWALNGDQKPKKKVDVADDGVNWSSLANTVTDVFRKRAEPKMIRAMKDSHGRIYCRAFLSTSYQIITNSDFFFAVYNKLEEIGAEFWSARLSENGFYGYAVAPGITAKVRLDRTYDPGDGWQSRWYGEKDDAVNAAISFGNEETGGGGIFVTQAVLRRVCSNFNVWHQVISRRHVGARLTEASELSESTIRSYSKAFLGEIGDIVLQTFNQERFQKMIDKMNESTQDAITCEDSDKAVEAVSVCFDIGESRRREILKLFMRNNDMSRYGLANAITEYAHSSERNQDAGYCLEKVASQVLETPMDDIFRLTKDKGNQINLESVLA